MRSAVITLQVVEALARRGRAGVSELARDLGLPKSTVQRCLLAAAEAGWITARPGEPWSVSPLVLGLLTGGVLPDLRAVARPVLAELAHRTGDAAHLVGRDGTDLVLLERIAGEHLVQVVVPLGFRVPIHAGATGKAMLAVMDPAAVEALLPATLRRLTARTVTQRAALQHELAAARVVGYATNLGEWDATVAAVAAAVVGRDGTPVGALSVSTTPDRLPPERTAELGPLVADAAATVSRALGS